MVFADDCPDYHDVGSHLTVMRHLQDLGHGLPELWGHDLAGAYPQIALRPGDSSYTMLIVPEGPTLWRHRAAPFGATASVWAFCRFGGLLSLARRYLLILAGDFVDDYTGVELSATSTSSCICFKEFFQKLGLAMKPEKEQMPAAKQKLLGVIVHAQDDKLSVETCPKRRDRILKELETIWEANAQRIAGKLGFMATTLFGGIGTAAIQPFFARAHNLGEQKNSNLTFAIRAAIKTLRQLLANGKPRTFPWKTSSQSPLAVIYSDAFFLLGERKMRARDTPELWNPKERRPRSNGWGYIVKLPSRVIFAHGELPKSFLDKFVSRKAFIYMMEILAAVLAVTFSRDELPPYFTMSIDNQAGKTALQKGYGSDCRHCRHETEFAKKEGWLEVDIDLKGMLMALEAFADDPEGSIPELLANLQKLQMTPSGVGGLHGVVRDVHPPVALGCQPNQPAEGEQKV
eukprot:s456_g16.t1